MTGWRFAVLQLQNLLAELIDRFEFEAPKDGRKVMRGAVSLFLPISRLLTNRSFTVVMPSLRSVLQPIACQRNR
jgi:hypothetical protein